MVTYSYNRNSTIKIIQKTIIYSLDSLNGFFICLAPTRALLR